MAVPYGSTVWQYRIAVPYGGTMYLQLPLVFRSAIHEQLSDIYTVPPPTLCVSQSESTLLLYYCWYCCCDVTLLAGNKQLRL